MLSGRRQIWHKPRVVIYKQHRHLTSVVDQYLHFYYVNSRQVVFGRRWELCLCVLDLVRVIKRGATFCSIVSNKCPFGRLNSREFPMFRRDVVSWECKDSILHVLWIGDRIFAFSAYDVTNASTMIYFGQVWTNSEENHYIRQIIQPGHVYAGVNIQRVSIKMVHVEMRHFDQ